MAACISILHHQKGKGVNTIKCLGCHMILFSSLGGLSLVSDHLLTSDFNSLLAFVSDFQITSAGEVEVIVPRGIFMSSKGCCPKALLPLSERRPVQG
uniref:Uncharacterized protein n=1 Tax=Engystomops pustulosus TaxID=76066 RepID=A0AAV6ZBC0_ENGPU|nr:hypothetical protein GDO81_024354 [Engystomops pustulosus]